MFKTGSTTAISDASTQVLHNAAKYHPSDLCAKDAAESCFHRPTAPPTVTSLATATISDPGCKTPVIEALGVTKTFGNGAVVALEGASFEARKGEFVALVGPSGCGKSTLLRIIAGLIPKSGGSLRIRGEEVTSPRADIGMMFQKATLLDWRTAIENVLLPTEVARRPTILDRRRAADLLRLVGLKDFLFAFPQQLSGGMQQRVALARLLQTGADILLLDEPFGALDEFTRERLNVELMRVVGEVGGTTFFVTHNIQEAIFLADRVMVMTPRPGRLTRIIDIPFPRPREMSIQQSPEFNALVSEVRQVLGGH